MLKQARAHAIGRAILGIIAVSAAAQDFHPDIPRAWDAKEVERFELPLAQRDRTPRYMSAEEYYKLKVRPIYRAYPVYATGREPAGYIDSLKQREPEIIFDASKLRTKEDWIAAGKLVFEAETFFSPAAGRPAPVPSPWKASSDGVLPPSIPGYRYYIRKKGVLEVGTDACSNCHVRIMPDGSFLSGGQGTTRYTSAAVLDSVRTGGPEVLSRFVEQFWGLYGAPWIQTKEEFASSLTKDELISELAAKRPYVLERQGTSRLYPPHVPSLIGIQDLHYLDATGLVHHRSIGDLMRYAIINEGLDTLAYFGDFQPSSKRTIFSAEDGTRYSDDQLYALALYIYSLRPPPNPNPFDDRARRGQQIFLRQGCSGCHIPPLYTSNKLTPAKGFEIPEDLRKSENILDLSVGTDPSLALKTRRGTGFYKVPSLRGVWYRSAFGHGGWAETLEEWLDPSRLRDDYVPQGFHIGPGPTRGHEFGLRLGADEKQALIAFLKTL
jgi:hypothetical protein